MKVNQSKNERIARVVAGLAILKSSKSAKMKLLGLVPLVTGATGYCPAKSKFLGIDSVKSGKCCSTNKVSDKKANDKKVTEKMDEATPA